MHTYMVKFIDAEGNEQQMEVEAPSPLMVIPELPHHRKIVSVQILD